MDSTSCGYWPFEYNCRLKELGLFSIYGRLLQADIIDVGLRDCLLWQLTRKLELVISRCELEIKNRFFHVRVIQRRDSLSEHPVLETRLSSFKRLLDLELGDVLYTML